MAKDGNRAGLWVLLAGAMVACEHSPVVQPDSEPGDATLDRDGGQVTAVWCRRFGDRWGDDARAVAVDPTGNVYLTGSARGTLDFGGGDLQCGSGSWAIFIASLTQDGGHRWSRCVGHGGGRALAVDAKGNLLVAGSFKDQVDFGGGPLTSAGGRDLFVASFDAAGAHRWSARWGGADEDHAYGVAAASGGAYITGETQPDLTTAGRLLVARFDAAGGLQWSQQPGKGRGAAVSVDAGGNPVFVGSFSETLILGATQLTSAGSLDIVLLGLDPTGAPLWSKGLGGPDVEKADCVVSDSSGNLYVGGTIEGTVDLGGGPLVPPPEHLAGFFASFAADGKHRWSRTFDTDITTDPSAVAIGPDGSLYIAGLGGEEDYDIDVLCLAPDGTTRWLKRLGGPGFDAGYGVAVDAAGAIYVAGRVAGTADLGCGPSTGAEQGDAFVIKLVAP